MGIDIAILRGGACGTTSKRRTTPLQIQGQMTCLQCVHGSEVYSTYDWKACNNEGRGGPVIDGTQKAYRKILTMNIIIIVAGVTIFVYYSLWISIGMHAQGSRKKWSGQNRTCQTP